MATVSEIFATMKEKVASDPAKVASLTAAYQFDLTGEGGGTYHAVFAGGSSDIGQGPAANPGCTVTMAANDFVALASGQLNPAAAFMTGKIKIKGDMALAMKLQSVL